MRFNQSRNGGRKCDKSRYFTCSKPIDRNNSLLNQLITALALRFSILCTSNMDKAYKTRPIKTSNIRLVRGKGSKGRGGGPGGFYWHVMADGVRAGAVFINIGDDGLPSIQLFLNQTHQGKGLGRLAYRLACAASALPILYAHMRKSNLASMKAAEHAGFTVCSADKQLTMIWKR